MREYYPNFDWLRLLLAIQVVAIHSGVAPTVFMNPVPAFLAISGFVVLGSIERRSKTQFIINRLLRVLPILALSFLAIGLLFSQQEMFHTIKFWLWPFGDPPINAVVWSLMYEEFYYVVLLILFSLGVYKLKILPIIIGMIFIVLTIMRNFFGLPESIFMLGGSFFIGNVAYIYRDTIKKLNKWIALIIFIIFVGMVYALPYNGMIDPDRVILDFLSFAAILIFAIAGPKLPKLSMDISYSLYLFHLIVRAQLLGYIPIGPKMFWIILLCTLPICYALWHLVELPIKNLKNGLRPMIHLAVTPTRKESSSVK